MDLQVKEHKYFASVFHELFHGQRNTYAVQIKEGPLPKDISYRRIKNKTILVDLYQQHLLGEEIIGIYPLLVNGKCLCACLDVDEPDLALAIAASNALPKPNHLERSRSGHYHIWMFFRKEVAAEKIEQASQGAIRLVREQTEKHCNLYPLPTTGLGLLIALPFHHTAVLENNTVFINAKGTPYANQYNYLREIKDHGRIDIKLLDGYGPESDIFKDKFLSSLYIGNNAKVKDKSASGYDFALCLALASRGWNKDDIITLLRSRPLVKSTKEEYLLRTVDASWDKAGRNLATTTIYKDEPAMFNEAKAPEPKVVDWDELEEIDVAQYISKLSESLLIKDVQRRQVEVFFAFVVANLRTQGSPVWLLIVGPPGCGKTISMQTLRHSPYTYVTSNLRPTALISGFGLKGKEDVSLIPKLDGKVLMVKDMSSLLSQNKEVLAETLGLLRDAYDGSCGRTFGTGVDRNYNSRFGFIGATTPDIDVNWSLNVRLGERFLRWRVRAPQSQVAAKIKIALTQINNEVEDTQAQEDAGLSFLKYLVNPEREMPALRDETRIAVLARLGGILRTSVARGYHNAEVLVIPEWEEGTRYAKQLAKVAVSLAHVRGKTFNGDEEFEDLKKIVRDSLDGRISKICQYLYWIENAKSAIIAAYIGLPDFTIRGCLEDLNICRIVRKEREAGAGYNITWSFIPVIRGMMTALKLWPKPHNFIEPTNPLESLAQLTVPKGTAAK